MAYLYLTNSLTNKKEKFTPIKDNVVGVYTCGPTVYSYATIGNFRTYVTSDILVRVLEYNGYQVKHVMNLTDVGHLTGDGQDTDLGEDKIEKAAKEQGRTAWEIAKYYTQVFLKDMKKLNIRPPSVMPKATDHIQEQIDLIKKLEEKGFTYKTSDGIYFDTTSFEEKTGKKYGELSTLDKIKAGARVEVNPEKKNPRDFALWKFSQKPGERHMEWESPWGIGFPGWHIECSAMSMKYLGESFDIHVGGEDLRSTHHPNEIAQSEGATGKPFVRFWLHVTFLQVEGKKMSKSLGNVYTIADLESKHFDPLALRYLYLTAHYKDTLNFTWEGLEAAQAALDKLRNQIAALRDQKKRTTLSSEKQIKVDVFRGKFLKAINDDLNTPQALAVLWEVLKSNLTAEDKYDLAVSFDEVFGLNLVKAGKARVAVPAQVKALATERERYRQAGDFKKADEIREEIKKMGWLVKDTKEGPVFEPLKKK